MWDRRTPNARLAAWALKKLAPLALYSGRGAGGEAFSETRRRFKAAGLNNRTSKPTKIAESRQVAVVGLEGGTD